MYKLESLNNKIKLITAPLKETQAVTVLVLIKVGSRYESTKLNGISHFIEHLLFKGTKRRPSSLHITKELDGVGANYNAFTVKDHTGYYIKVNKEHLELALDILSDMLFKSLFEAKEISRERGVIIEEINMYEDNPQLLIGDVFEDTIYHGHPLGTRIIGPKENIQKIKREELKKFYKDYYLSQNLIVGIAGNFNEDKIKNLANKYFGKIKVSSKLRNSKKCNLTQKSPRVNLLYKETQQVQMALGFPAFKNIDPRIYPLSLLSIILGGNMSSRLFMEIRERRGLAYFIRSSVNPFEDISNLYIQSGLDQSRIEIAIKTVLQELKKIKDKGVTNEELARAKEFLKGNLILQLEDSADLIGWLAEQKMLKGKVENLEQKIKKIKAVTLTDVKKVAEQVIDFKKINLALIGPFKDKEKFLNIIINSKS